MSGQAIDLSDLDPFHSSPKIFSQPSSSSSLATPATSTTTSNSNSNSVTPLPLPAMPSEAVSEHEHPLTSSFSLMTFDKSGDEDSGLPPPLSDPQSQQIKDHQARRREVLNDLTREPWAGNDEGHLMTDEPAQLEQFTPMAPSTTSSSTTASSSTSPVPIRGRRPSFSSTTHHGKQSSFSPPRRLSGLMWDAHSQVPIAPSSPLASSHTLSGNGNLHHSYPQNQPVHPPISDPTVSLPTVPSFVPVPPNPHAADSALRRSASRSNARHHSPPPTQLQHPQQHHTRSMSTSSVLSDLWSEFQSASASLSASLSGSVIIDDDKVEQQQEHESPQADHHEEHRRAPPHHASTMPQSASTTSHRFDDHTAEQNKHYDSVPHSGDPLKAAFARQLVSGSRSLTSLLPSDFNKYLHSTTSTPPSTIEERPPLPSYDSSADDAVQPIKLSGVRDGVQRCLDEDVAEGIRPNLPPRLKLSTKWNLLYSLDQHGISILTMYERMRVGFRNSDAGVVVVVKDQWGSVFGAYANEPLKDQKTYYGDGTCFLWKATPFPPGDFRVGSSVKAFKWSGRNSYFILSESNYLSIGGGDGKFGLWIDGVFDKGHTARSPCFQNEPLTDSHHWTKGPGGNDESKFEVMQFEVWTISL